jgi:hypothetical protein
MEIRLSAAVAMLMICAGAWLLPADASSGGFLEFRRAEPMYLEGAPFPFEPVGLAWDGEHILVATGVGPVLWYGPELRSGFVGQDLSPRSTRDIAYLGGAIYGYSTVKGRFERWDTDGYEVIDLPWAPGQGWGITTDGTYLYMCTGVAGSGRFYVAAFEPSGELHGLFQSPLRFDGLAYAMGDLYGLCGWNIYRMTTDGELLGVQAIRLPVWLGAAPTGHLTAYHRFLIVGFPPPSDYCPDCPPRPSHLVELEIVWTRDVKLSTEEGGTVVTWDCDPAYSGYRVESADALVPDPLWQVRFQILGVPAWQRSLRWTDTQTGIRRSRFYRVRAIE